MKKKIDIKKTQVFTMISVTLMILVSFTAVANSPVSDGEEFKDIPAPAFERASDSLADTLSDYKLFKLPGYIDITGLDLSEEDLANLKKQAESAEKLASAIEGYAGEEFQVISVPVIQDGVELMTIPMMDFDSIPTGMDGPYDNLNCDDLFTCALFYSSLAILWTLIGSWFLNVGDTEYAGAAFAAALECAAVAAFLFKIWKDKGCGSGQDSESSSNVQATIETIMNGGTVEISEIQALLDMMPCAN